MPISRYHLRCPSGISDPALYSSDGRDNPQAILQGVATAGLTGTLRQLGDLAEFAAEIFHELHKDVMSVVARGQGLTVRVQQLESRFPAIEKILFSRSDNVEVYVPKGTDWHPSPQASHNLISLQDIPKFMSDSYEECHGPPPLFMLDKFDSAGAGACLRRYSDPSFFKRNSSFPEVQNLEYKKERLTQKTKVKVMHLRDDEPAGFSSVLDVHAKRLHMVTEQDRNNIPSKCTRLKIRPPNYLNETSEDSDQQIIESHGVCTSCIPIFENQRHVTEIASNNQTANLSVHQQMLTGDTNVEELVVLGETKLVDSDELKFLSPNSGKVVKLEALGQYATKAEQSPDRFSTTELCVLSRMQVHSTNAKEKVDANTDGNASADISSDIETYNYVDALTTYESEHEASDEKNPEIESLTMDSDLIGQQAVLDEVSNNCCSKDTRSEIDEYSSADYSPDLDDVTAKNIYHCRNGGSSNVLEVESTFNPLCTDPVLLFENGLKNVHIDITYARSENAASEEPEDVNSLSHEFGYGLTKICINENGRVSDSTLSQENYADDVLSPLGIKLTGTSADVLASSSCIPASASSTTGRDYVQSSNLCGVGSVLRCSSPAADVIQNNEAPPHLPPPPPVEWTTGNNQLGPSLLDMTSGNTQNKSNSLLPVGEIPTQAGKCDNLNTSSLVQMQTPNSIISQNCHSVSEEGTGHTGSSKMMVMEEEEIEHQVPSLHFGIKQQVTPAVKDEKFVPQCEKHENKTSSLNTADSMTGLIVSEDSVKKELQPLTDTLNAGELPGCASESPTPASVVTVQHGSPHKSECESMVEPMDMSKEVEEDISNGKLHFHGIRLRDPLIEAVASHDKSKFRKVSQVIKISDKLVTDQRNALLEEIRNKAFTLRPVSLARPSIKGPPVTNSKLLEILVKASTIRQALAGSDEDDEENWQ